LPKCTKLHYLISKIFPGSYHWTLSIGALPSDSNIGEAIEGNRRAKKKRVKRRGRKGREEERDVEGKRKRGKDGRGWNGRDRIDPIDEIPNISLGSGGYWL